MNDDCLRRRKTGKPGEPYVVLTEEEAEFLVLHGWTARKRKMRWKPAPKANGATICEPEEEEDIENPRRPTCR